MYYILFSYKSGKQGERSWRYFNSEADVIEFLHDHYKQIDVDQIIEVKERYRLGLVVTDDYIKSTLVIGKENESLVELEGKPEEIIKKNKEKLEELEEKPSAMETIADEIEEEIKEDELTPEQKTKKALDDADNLIAREKEREKQKNKGWKLCTKCNSNRVAPWNKKKICSPCQAERKTTRPYTRSKEFAGL